MKIEDILIRTSEIVASNLNIEVPEIRYFRNFQSKTLGYSFDNKPGVIFLDLEEIKLVTDNNELKTILYATETVLHEMRHLWQMKNNWDFEHHIPYERRKCEIDAREYAKTNTYNIINEIYEERISA